MHVDWKGIFPAVTTQFKADESLDLTATNNHVGRLLDDLERVHSSIMSPLVWDLGHIAAYEDLCEKLGEEPADSGSVPPERTSAAMTTKGPSFGSRR